MVKTLLCGLLLTAPFTANAADAWQWKLVPETSSIAWQATQNHAPVTGGFESFTTDIHFHPEALEQSNVTVSIETASITSTYGDEQSTLKTQEWFFVDSFPTAAFATTSFTALGENRYRAAAQLTIKDKTVPATLEFELKQFDEQKAHIVGEAVIKRNDFNIGWAETEAIADEVTVKVEINASR